MRTTRYRMRRPEPADASHLAWSREPRIPEQQLTAPVGSRQVSVAHKNAIRGLASRGSTLEAIAADTGIPVEAVRRVLAE